MPENMESSLSLAFVKIQTNLRELKKRKIGKILHRQGGIGWSVFLLAGLAAGWSGGWAGAVPSEPGAFIPSRVLWVDQNDPKAADSADGSEGTPFKTLAEAAQAVRPGDVVRIRTGFYRENIDLKTSGTADKPIRFEAGPGAHVVVTGADVVQDALTREPGADNIFSMPWSHKILPYGSWPGNLPSDGSGTWPNDDFHKLIGRCEQVIVDGYLLHQVLQRSQLSRGSFYVDLQNQRLYVWDSSNIDMKGPAATVEASVRSEIWTSEGSYVQIAGLRFRYATNSAQHGAINLLGDHDMIEDCIVERTNGVGLTLHGKDLVARRCVLRDNGEMGFGGFRCLRLLVTECEIRNNNTKGFSREWECGNSKITLTRDGVIEKSTFADSRGFGLWFDCGNENCTVRNCLFTNNENAGLYDEISYGLHVEDNVFVGNGFDSDLITHGATGAIGVAASPGTVIERNLMVGNYAGFQLREGGGRTTPRIDRPDGAPEDPIWNHDETLRNNVIAYNLTEQIGYWLDNKGDYRQWPLAMRSQFSGQAQPDGPVVPDMAKDYQAKDNKGQPVGLSLEDLKFHFQNNIYSKNAGEKFGLWGVPWYDHKEYADLDSMRADLKLENGSVSTPIVFASPAMGDFRVPANSPALAMNCYPKGDVPGIKLGVLP
jgi:hypothetical protein